MASPLLAHIVGRVQADIDFLVAQNVISPADGQAMAARLPGARAPAVTVRPPPPPPPPSEPQARTLWAYNVDRQEPDDLAFGAGETVAVVEEVNADWWRGRNARGETGLFPANYVEKVPRDAAPAYSAPAPAVRVVPPAPSGKGSYDPPAPPAQEQEPQAAAAPKKGKFGKFGGTMAQSAAGGVGFGAGAAVGSGIIHAIF